MGRQLTWAATASAVVVAAAVVWAVAAGRPAVADPALSPAAAASGAIDTLAAAPGVNLRRTVTVQVVQQTKGAVVNISTRKLIAERVRLNPMFDFSRTVNVPANSLGSGFLIHRDGYVVTNNHVIDKARQISVELDDGRTLPADVVGADPDADLAVLRIHSPTPLPTLALGDSGDLMIGEPTIAVGNPLGYSHTVSTGIVSALHRDLKGSADHQAEPVRGEDAALRDLVQTDAAINPGNSGGPLLNAYGQVIGINTAIAQGQNIGFAIPINRLRDLIPELMNPSLVTKVDVPLHLAERRTVTEPATVHARVVTAGDHPAEVTALDGRRPLDVVDACAALLDLHAGQPFTVTFAGGQSQRLTTTATPLPDAIVQAKQRFGLSVVANTPMLAERYRLAREDGLLVTAVAPGGIGAKAGVQPGDVIRALDRYQVNRLDDFSAIVAHLPATGQTPVGVLRGNGGGYLLLRY